MSPSNFGPFIIFLHEKNKFNYHLPTGIIDLRELFFNVVICKLDDKKFRMRIKKSDQN